MSDSAQDPGTDPLATSSAPASQAAAQPPRKRRKRRLWFRLALGLGFPLLTFFVVGEIVVRLKYPGDVAPRAFFKPGIYESAPWPRKFRLAKSYEGKYHHQTELLETRVNALGMRGEEATPERLAAERRVLFIGDSVTFGLGVAEGVPFAHQLEERLAETTGKQVATFNGGVAGYENLQAHDALLEFGPQLKPHLVVLGWYRNDVEVPAPDAGPAKVFDGYLAQSEEKYLRFKHRYIDKSHPADWSALIRLIRVQWKNLKLSWELAERAAQQAEQAVDEEGFAASQDALGQIKAWCDAQGIPFAVILCPAREEIEADPPAEPVYNARLTEHLESQGVTVIDLIDPWRAHWRETGETLYLPRDRCHPNRKGHAVISDWLQESLAKLLD